ncbi:MAG: CDC48 family AAA ATPase [Candidatus Hodarchaeales archaeon]|jgi:transitional endoplasmic reticulum ATPase
MVEVDSPVKSRHLRLQVKAADIQDVGKSFARISETNLKELGLNPGDLAEIVGSEEKRTTVVVWVAPRKDEGKDIIRIDGTVRANAGTALDEFVTVRKTEVISASYVELSPTGRYSLRGAGQYFKRELKGNPISVNDKLRIRAGNRVIEYVIIKIQPESESGSLLVDENTDLKIIISKESKKDGKKDQLVPKIAYEDIGGLKETIDTIREMVELPFRFPELFTKLGISPPKGLLMYGPPGTGKTLLARAVASETKSNFFFFSGPDIYSKYSGEAEKKIRELFEEARKKAPSIIFIDEIDSIAPRREESSDTTKTVVAQLLALMDGIETRGEVIVIGATNLPNAIDPALRRPGRFDREIEIGVPNQIARRDILYIHTRNMPLDGSVSLTKLAEMTHGFVGADLASLAREAAFRSIRRYLPEINWEDPALLPFQVDDIRVTMSDFTSALFSIKPSGLREIFIEIPNVTWDKIGGLKDIKQSLRESIEWPIRFPEIFNYANIKPPKGVLLFGSPGTGKTHIVRALANETRFNLISVKGSELLSKWVGESERAVREMFRKAKQVSPCLLFFDEIDSLIPVRQQSINSGVGASERVVSALLAEIDGLEELSDVFIIAATNRPDRVDPALIRPGRFDRLLYLSLPTKEERLEILQIHTSFMPLVPDVSLNELAELCKGVSGASLENLCKEAAMLAIREFMEKDVINRFGDFSSVSPGALKIILSESPFYITRDHFNEALKNFGGSLKEQDTRLMASFTFAQEKGLIDI